MTLSEKDPVEIVPVTFGFAAVPAGTITLEVSVIRGYADANTSAMLVGGSQVSGNDVLQLVGGGLDGRDYLLRCTVDTGSERYVNACILPVRRQEGR